MQGIYMRIHARHAWFLLFTLILVFLLTGCNNPLSYFSHRIIKYTSYRDIPGVTGDDIRAIDAIREKYGSLVYGAIPSTETFYTTDGEVGGYSALLCDWLSELFGIPFVPRVYEWGDILPGLESGVIDFNGDMMLADERQKKNKPKKQCKMQ